MEKTNENLTIAGKRVEVRYSNNVKDCCCRCPFSSDDACTVLDEQYVIPCRKHDKDGKFAYFVPAEEIEGTPQKVTLIPSNEDDDSVAITRSMDYVDGIPDGGTREHPWNDHDVERGYQAGFRDGIGWERERKMQRVGEEWGDKVAENPEIIFSTDGELTVYSFVGAPRWWATIREAEEALSVFKAGICWRKAQMEKRITLIQKSWYEQGKIDGKYEGLTDDEKYQQGAFDERERLMKDAVEIEVSNVGILQMGSILTDKGIFAGDTIQVIIIKKEK